MHEPGPYNPTASVATKVVKRLDLEFVEMSEITIDDDFLDSSGRPTPARLPITDLSQWIESYAVMAVFLSTRFPQIPP